MKTFEELTAHYKAIRLRLNAGPPAKPELIEPEPDPEPIVEEPVVVPKADFVPFTPSQAIIHEIAMKHELSMKDIKGPSRILRFVIARQEAAYEIRKQLNLSFPMIGRALGNRDHTTILHAVRKHAKRNNLPDLTIYKRVETQYLPVNTEMQNESVGNSL